MGRLTALSQLHQHKIESLVIVGGNGSQKGAQTLYLSGFPMVGVASTIDNDLFGSDITIGEDTALNVSLEAIYRVRLTASSHHRAFFVEVMGHKCGYLALMAAIAGGAEAAIIPEEESDPETVAAELHAAYDNGKAHAIGVVAEGARYNAEGLAQYFKKSGSVGFRAACNPTGTCAAGGSTRFF